MISMSLPSWLTKSKVYQDAEAEAEATAATERSAAIQELTNLTRQIEEQHPSLTKAICDAEAKLTAARRAVEAAERDLMLAHRAKATALYPLDRRCDQLRSLLEGALSPACITDSLRQLQEIEDTNRHNSDDYAATGRLLQSIRESREAIISLRLLDTPDLAEHVERIMQPLPAVAAVH